MAGGKKARAKLKSERLKNRSRAGNGSDPSPPEGVGSSDTARSAVDEFLGGFASTGASIETMMRDLMMAPTGTGNGDALADASDRAKGIDRGQLLDCLREGSSLPGVSRFLSGDFPDDIEGLEGELNDMFRSLPLETQNTLLEMQMNATGTGLNGRELFLLDAGFRCLELETPAVRSAVREHMQKNVNPGNQMPEQRRAELFKLLVEVKAKPETVRVFEVLVAALGSSENQERDSAAMDVLETPNAVVLDDDDSSGPPSLAPSDDDDDDPRRSVQEQRADALECLKFETPAVRNAVVEHFQKTVDNIKVTPGNRRPLPPQLRADLFKLLAEVKAKPETVATFEAMIENAENQERERVAVMDVLENPNAVAEDDDGSSGPPSLAPSDDDDDDPRRSIRKEDEKNDSSAPPSLASSSGSDDDEDDRARTKVSDENKNKTPLLPEHVPEKGKGRVPLDATPASDSSSQPPSLASSPESSPAASPRASRVPSEAHIAGASGSGTKTVDPEASPSEALNAFFDPGEAKKKEAAKKKKRSAETDDKKERVDDPTPPSVPKPVPETETKPKRNASEKHKRFSAEVSLARKLARASVAKARETHSSINADGGAASTSGFRSPVSGLDTLAASREAQFAYYRARCEANDGDDDSPWIRLRRVRRVREELNGRLGIDGSGSGSETNGGDESEKESVGTSTSLASLCDALARRCVDDATFLEWLMSENIVAHTWRYENTVRTCEFHNQPLRESFGSGETRTQDGPSPSRCYEFAPEVSGAARSGPRCARSLGRCFEVSCAAGHTDVVVHARCWHRNCVEKDEDLVYGPLLARLPVEEGVDPETVDTGDGEEAHSPDGLVERQRAPRTFLTFATTEEPAELARRRACAMWVTKFPSCPVAGCDAPVTNAVYFSDAVSSETELHTSYASCDNWHDFFGSELTPAFGDAESGIPTKIACVLGADERTPPKNFETVVDFVVAREALIRAKMNSAPLTPDDDQGSWIRFVVDLFETARDLDTKDRDGSGVVRLPDGLTQDRAEILNCICAIRQGRVLQDGRIAAAPAAPEALFSLATSTNPFFVDKRSERFGMCLMGTLLALASSAFDESPGHQLPDESRLERFRFDGDLSELGDSVASRFISVRNPDDDDEDAPSSRVTFVAVPSNETSLVEVGSASSSHLAFKRFCEVYFDALHEALRETRRRAEAFARDVLRTTQPSYDAMRSVREEAYDAMTRRTSRERDFSKTSASHMRDKKAKAKACSVSYPEVEAIAEANQRDLLEEEERDARRLFYKERLAARALEAKREKQRMKKKAKKKREQEERETEQARVQAELVKKEAEKEKRRQQAEAKEEEALRRSAAEEAEREKNADAARRKAEEKVSAKKAKEKAAAGVAAAAPNNGAGASSSRGPRTTPGSSQTPQVPERVPLRVFLTYVMRNHAVCERWRRTPNPGCVSCAARLPERHKETCAVPFAACDASTPNDALRALQEDPGTSTPFADERERDALERAFAGLAPPSGAARDGTGAFFSASGRGYRAWTPPAPAPAPAPTQAVHVPPAVSAPPARAWTSSRDHPNVRARNQTLSRHVFQQPAPVPKAFADAAAFARKEEKDKEEAAMCIICHETNMDETDIAASAARECGCGQLMHMLCLTGWLDTTHDSTCPVCRKKIKSPTATS